MPAPLNVGMTQDNRYVQRSSVFLCRFQTHRQLQRTHKVTFKHKFTPACALFWQCRDKTGKKHRKWWYVPFPCAKTFVFRSLLIMAAAKVRKIAVFWSSLTFWTGFFVFRYKFYSCFSHKNIILPQISTLILRYVEYKVFLRSTARDSSERSDPSKILHKSVGKFHGTTARHGSGPGASHAAQLAADMSEARSASPRTTQTHETWHWVHWVPLNTVNHECVTYQSEAKHQELLVQGELKAKHIFIKLHTDFTRCFSSPWEKATG